MKEQTEYLSAGEVRRIQADSENCCVIQLPNSTMADNYLLFDGPQNRLIIGRQSVVAMLVQNAPEMIIVESHAIPPRVTEFIQGLRTKLALATQDKERIEKVEATRLPGGANKMTDEKATYTYHSDSEAESR